LRAGYRHRDIEVVAGNLQIEIVFKGQRDGIVDGEINSAILQQRSMRAELLRFTSAEAAAGKAATGWGTLTAAWSNPSKWTCCGLARFSARLGCGRNCRGRSFGRAGEAAGEAC